MKPVMQSLLHDVSKGIRGDCFRACICSLLEIDITEAPNFVEYSEDEWWDVVIEFCRTHGYSIRWEESPPTVNGDFYIAMGMGPRGFRHAVVHQKGKLVHDPHPIGGDVIADCFAWLVPLED